MIDFASILRQGQTLLAMPGFTIDERTSDVFITYNKEKTRLDRIAYDVYSDPTCWRIIMWANPEYFVEFDIPDNTQIRVPFPMNEVQFEIIEKLEEGKYRETI